ncbi:MAG: hypothetical protein ACKOWO_07540 [Sediminibacterium sp.]
MENGNSFLLLLTKIPIIIACVWVIRKIAAPNIKENINKAIYVMKSFFIRLKYYLLRIVRISYSVKARENFVWKELKKLQSAAKWHHGVYESERYVETTFAISEDTPAPYYYMIYDGNLHCRVKIHDNYPVELTTQLFILASHFNNLLNSGVVVVNVDKRYIEYHLKTDILIPTLYTGEIQEIIIRHYNTSKDIFWAFNELIYKNEEPALIIADLLRSKNQDNAQN